jgi:hypothetical protein
MRSLSLKDIIEYIAAAVVIIFSFFIIAILYALFNIESYSEYTYQQFTNSLLIDRLNYCLYEDTGNPLLLFYAPNPNIISEYNIYQQCFMNLSGTFYYLINKVNQSSEVIYTYLNLSYDDYIYFFFYNINNISYSYYYDPYGLAVENNINVNPYYVAYNIHNIDYIYEGLPSLDQFLINYFYKYSLYIYKEIEHAYQTYKIINIDEKELNLILHTLLIGGIVNYDVTYIQPITSYYITLPEYDSGEPIIVSLYGVGNLYMNGIYNETCNTIAGGQINVSSCQTTELLQ